jgi:hypothetical protein
MRTMKQYIRISEDWKLAAPEGNGWLDIPSMPMGVHEILHNKKLISDDFLIGQGRDSQWVAERDWEYRVCFKAPALKGRACLHFKQLDTIARIVLNGEEIARSEDLYLPLRVDVSGKLKEENLLEVHLRSPYAFLKEHPLPPEWAGKMPHNKIIRKSICDFSNYLGAQPYLTLIGIFGDVTLEVIDRSEFTVADTVTMLAGGYQTGALNLTLAAAPMDGLSARAVLRDPDGARIGACEFALPSDGSAAVFSMPVPSPRLWWPRGYGEQPLYTVETTLLCGGDAIDRFERQVGFRELRMALDFDLHVNGVKVRMWGSNLSPLDGKTHRWNGERAKALLDLAEFANMNTMRVWGEGEPFDDELYRECDRRGILIWQEFFGAYGMQPDSAAYFDLCLREAEHMMNRLKHHPCIFMWCGGNECLMGGEYDHPGEKVVGFELYSELYPALCARIDPTRYYHITSPYGGEWAGDPRVGDTHGYDFWWYVPGMDYPVAYSEHMRVSGPALKSMKRWIPEDKIWPEAYVDSTIPSKRAKDLMPAAWFERVANSLDIKAGPIHEFRDADTPEELAFKYSAAHAKAFKDGIKRSRMGRPSGSKLPRISNLHLIWKFSDTWPLIYSAIVDYYLEPYMPFYEAKRSYSPVMVCFDIRDSINLWLVNDSTEDVSGTVEFGLFSPGGNRFTVLKSMEASMPAGQSGEVTCLDFLGQFRTENVLYARFIDAGRGVDYTNIDYVDTDRRLVFPEAKLSLSVDGDVLSITSDRFARIVELSGDEGGDEFGWLFEDNYFDLMPGVVKKVRIGGNHEKGIIAAKAHYSPHATTLEWK